MRGPRLVQKSEQNALADRAPAAPVVGKLATSCNRINLRMQQGHAVKQSRANVFTRARLVEE